MAVIKKKKARKPLTPVQKKALVARLQAGRKKAGLASTAKKKTPAKKKMPAKRKTPVSRSPKFVIKVVTAGNKTGYAKTATASGITSLDTTLAAAKHFTESAANSLATAFFNVNKKYLKSVQVVAVKK